MDFNSFCKNRSSSVSHEPIHVTQPEDIINKSVNTYSHLSDDEMMQALFQVVNKEKSSGVFDINNIWTFYKNISPMLDNISRNKMRSIIESIELGR